MRKILMILCLLVSLSVFPRQMPATYFQEDGRWYFGFSNRTDNTEVVGAHIPTFRLVCNGGSRACWSTPFARDRRFVYFQGRRIIGVHLRTWELIAPIEGKGRFSLYSRDRRNVFFGGTKIEGADRDSFEDISSGLGHRTPFFGRDKNSIFRGVFRTSYDVATFREVCIGFTADKLGIYYQGKLLEGTCLNDFRLLNLYVVSNNRVFFRDQKLNADAKSFQVLAYKRSPFSNASGLDFTIARDKNHIFIDGQKLAELDVETFVIVNLYYRSGLFRGGAIVKDKNGTFQIRNYFGFRPFDLIPIETE